jgi:sugar lactone lactonase YvrE
VDDPKAEVLLSGLAFPESARWHQGRLWFAHWGTGEIMAADLDGRTEVVARGPSGLGWSIDWLPDGRLLVTGPELLRQERDGSMTRHADLTGVAGHGWNEIAVDGRGNVYVNGFDFDLPAGAPPAPGIIALVTPDGAARQVAGGLQFPNGMVVTPDGSTLIVAESFAGRLTAFDIAPDGGLVNRRIWAAGVGPDGICLDAEGGVWSGAADIRMMTGRAGDPAGACLRVREGGQVSSRIELDQPMFACALGGPDGRTLFMLTAPWRGFDQVTEMIAERAGQVLVVRAPVPGARRR